MLTQEELYAHSHLVQAADAREVKSFIDDKVFRLIRRSEAPIRPMDCLWVRKWKRKPTAKDPGEVKSRLVVRGFLDPQKRHVSRYSGTATRLSQRLLVSLAVEHDLDLEQWDIGNAFLKGFSFDMMKQMCHKFGITVPDVDRQVVITVPGNVWYHIAQFGFCKDASACAMQYALFLLKAMYGLVDAPILRSIALRHFIIVEMKGKPSRYDENFIYWTGTTENGNHM